MYEPKELYSKFYMAEKDEDEISFFDLLENEEIIAEFKAVLDEIKSRKQEFKPIPERMAIKEKYIKDCIKFSEKYKVSLKIFEYPNGLHVYFCFTEPKNFNELVPVFALSDEVVIVPEDYLYDRKIGIILDFNTHEIIISPD